MKTLIVLLKQIIAFFQNLYGLINNKQELDLKKAA